MRPQINITCFSIFNQQGQLCAIESNFVENKIDLYMSGYLKTNSTKLNLIDDESVPAKEIGPILQWYVIFDKSITIMYSYHPTIFVDLDYAITHMHILSSRTQYMHIKI